jgi:predicted dehydrogenase
MNRSKITIGQLGCGYWGPNLLRNFAAQPSCVVKWLADPDEARRAFVSQSFEGVSTTANWHQVIGDEDVDAVVIATPASSHHGLVKAALEAGKHVLVEKPLALSTEHAQELVDLAASQSKTLMVGHTFLYNAAVRHIKKLLDAGDIGELYYVYSQRLNLGQVRQDVNAWWNLAPHDISILMYLLDGQLPAQISLAGVDRIQPGIEDMVFANLKWKNRVMASVQVSWLDPSKVRRMTLVGSRKMIIYDDLSEQKIAVIDKGVDKVPRIGERMDFDSPDSFKFVPRFGQVSHPEIEFIEPLKAEAAHFLECIVTGQTPISGPEHARDVVAVLEAGQKSIEKGAPVDLI